MNKSQYNLFNQMGGIINEYVPELYESKILPIKHVTHITSDTTPDPSIYANTVKNLTLTGAIITNDKITMLSKYEKLEELYMNNFKGKIILSSSSNGWTWTEETKDQKVDSDEAQLIWNSRRGKYENTLLFNLNPLSSLETLKILELDSYIENIEFVRGLYQLTSLSINSYSGDIDPLSYLTNLKQLYFDATHDLSPISYLTNLTHLSIYSIVESDINYLATLTNLKELTLLTYDGDISILQNFVMLESLYIDAYDGSDLSPLSSLVNLTELGLGTFTGDLSPLSSLVNLTELELLNFTGDLSPLSSLVNLTYLELGNIKGDLSPLSSLVNLTNLELGTFTGDIYPLLPLVNLAKLTLYRFKGDISPLLSLVNLTELKLE